MHRASRDGRPSSYLAAGEDPDPGYTSPCVLAPLREVDLARCNVLAAPIAGLPPFPIWSSIWTCDPLLSWHRTCGFHVCLSLHQDQIAVRSRIAASDAFLVLWCAWVIRAALLNAVPRTWLSLSYQAGFVKRTSEWSGLTRLLREKGQTLVEVVVLRERLREIAREERGRVPRMNAEV